MMRGRRESSQHWSKRKEPLESVKVYTRGRRTSFPFHWLKIIIIRSDINLPGYICSFTLV